jgi:hypothetical protein
VAARSLSFTLSFYVVDRSAGASVRVALTESPGSFGFSRVASCAEYDERDRMTPSSCHDHRSPVVLAFGELAEPS